MTVNEGSPTGRGPGNADPCVLSSTNGDLSSTPHGGGESRYRPPASAEPAGTDTVPRRHGDASGERRRGTWTADDVRALGVRTDVPTAGSIFGLSRTQAYAALARGAFPVGVIRVGRRYLVPVAPILHLLGLDPHDSPGTQESQRPRPPA